MSEPNEQLIMLYDLLHDTKERSGSDEVMVTTFSDTYIEIHFRKGRRTQMHALSKHMIRSARVNMLKDITWRVKAGWESK